MDTNQLLEALKDKNKTLDQLLEEFPTLTFVSYIEELINLYKTNKSIVIKESGMDRSYGYEILRGDKEGSKDKIIRLSLAMHLSLEETNRLLTLSNNGMLYPKQKRDACIIFCINQHYNVIKTNEVLDDYHFESLQ